MKTTYRLAPLVAPVDGAFAAAFAAMTFPIYRPLLQLKPVARHPEQGDARRIQPVAIAAYHGGEPVGLLVGETPLDVRSVPEMLSLFVAPDHRGRGVATDLVAHFEALLTKAGSTEVGCVFTTGKPAIRALERVLWKRGWAAPKARSVSVRFAPQAALASDLFNERRMRVLGAHLDLFPWVEMSSAERTHIAVSDRLQPWITPALAPWRFDRAGVDPVSSIGARRDGKVVGWVLNHQVSPGIVRFTCSYMRKDISRRGRIIPLYFESLKRLAASDCRECTFITPVIYPNMLHFIERWLVPVSHFVGETRGSGKRLGNPPSASS
jgi:GNAT superfamily N-acetyltransferase